MLEGMVEYSKYTKDTESLAVNMQKAVSYLLKHQVFMSTAGREIPDVEWDKIIFPRFYEYDFSRGLEAILDFLLLTGKKVRGVAVEQALALLRKKTDSGLAHSEKQWLSTEKTVSYYIEKPIVFQEMANVPLLMKKLNNNVANEFVPALLARISRKHEEARTRGLIV